MTICSTSERHIGQGLKIYCQCMVPELFEILFQSLASIRTIFSSSKKHTDHSVLLKGYLEDIK